MQVLDDIGSSEGREEFGLLPGHKWESLKC